MKEPAVDYIIRPNDMVKVLGVSKAQLYRMVKAGDFPPPLKISERSSGWRTSDYHRWLDQRAAAQ